MEISFRNFEPPQDQKQLILEIFESLSDRLKAQKIRVTIEQLGSRYAVEASLKGKFGFSSCAMAPDLMTAVNSLLVEFEMELNTYLRTKIRKKTQKVLSA